MANSDIEEVTCPACGAAYRVRSEFLGKKAKCRACNWSFVIAKTEKKRAGCPQCGRLDRWTGTDGTNCGHCGFPGAKQKQPTSRPKLEDYVDEVLQIAGITPDLAQQIGSHERLKAVTPALREFTNRHPEISQARLFLISDAVGKRLGIR